MAAAGGASNGSPAPLWDRGTDGPVRAGGQAGLRKSQAAPAGPNNPYARIDQTPCLTSGRKRGWAGLTATRRELAVDGTRGRASVATSRRCSLPEMKICAGVVLAPPLHDSGSTTVRVYS